MQFLTILLATSAAASSVLERDLATINAIMNQVKENMVNFDSTLLTYKGASPYTLETAAQKMTNGIQDATSKVARTGNLTLSEAQGFQPTSDALNAAGDKLLADIKSRIPLFGYMKECETVLSWTTQLSSAVSTLMTTISAHFPSGGKGGKEIDHFGATFVELKADLKECAHIQYTNRPSASHSSSSSSYVAAAKQTLFQAPAVVTPMATYVPVPAYHGNNSTMTARKTTSSASKTEGAAAAAKQTAGGKDAKAADNVVTGAGSAVGFSGAGMVAVIAALAL